jgi:hypothetical protein
MRYSAASFYLCSQTFACLVLASDYAPGAIKEPGHSWECGWQTDRSGQPARGLGCAGSTPKSQTAAGAHASAEACEKWCCEAEHVKVGPSVPGGWEATLVDAGPACNFWQWTDLHVTGNGGCWIGVVSPAVPYVISPVAPGVWIGAEGCTRRAGWGAEFLVVFGISMAVYLAGGVVYGKRVVS